MSKTTRINRPTYATMRHRGRMIHQSTHYAWMPLTDVPGGPVRFIKVEKGRTFRRHHNG